MEQKEIRSCSACRTYVVEDHFCEYLTEAPPTGRVDENCQPIYSPSPTQKTEEKGRKDDSEKPRLDLLPFKALEGIADVLAFGAIKYGEYNYTKGMNWSRLVAAALRHIFAWAKGEQFDKESKKSHLFHALCCLLFLAEYERMQVGTDDRFKT